MKKYFELLQYRIKDDVILKKIYNKEQQECTHECNKRIRRRITFEINDQEMLCQDDHHPIEFDFEENVNVQLIDGCGYIVKKVKWLFFIIFMKKV